jgi:hypothetical protein
MAALFRRISDNARARLVGIDESDAWPPANRRLELEGEDGVRYLVSDWAFVSGWERADEDLEDA